MIIFVIRNPLNKVSKMNEYEKQLENLKQDYEQLLNQNFDVRMEFESVTCQVNQNEIKIGIQDKELESKINNAIKQTSYQYKQNFNNKMSGLNKRRDELVAVFREMAEKLPKTQ